MTLIFFEIKKKNSRQLEKFEKPKSVKHKRDAEEMGAYYKKLY